MTPRRLALYLKNPQIDPLQAGPEAVLPGQNCNNGAWQSGD